MAKKNLVKLFIYSKLVETKTGRKFRDYSTKALFKMNGVEGKVEKWIKVKFTRNAFVGANIRLDDIKNGTLVVDGSNVGLPTTWEVTKDANGKDIYPICWIRGGIESFTPSSSNHTFEFVLHDENDEQLEELE